MSTTTSRYKMQLTAEPDYGKASTLALSAAFYPFCSVTYTRGLRMGATSTNHESSQPLDGVGPYFTVILALRLGAEMKPS